jgi:hypothetical protein
MNINSYFKQKLKEKNVKVNTLIAETNTSKSTLYRVMTGLQKPSDKLKNRIAEVLDFSTLELQQLEYLLALSDIDDNLISAREEVYKLLFQPKSKEFEKLELVYYEKKQYVKSFEGILKTILTLSTEDDFSWDIRMINCNQSRIINPLLQTVTDLINKNIPHSFEHLVNFSTYDYKENIRILNHLIPLLELQSYVVKYRETTKVSNQGFFHNFIIIDYSYHSQSKEQIKEKMCLTFLPNNLSSCYVVDHENMGDFFERNFDAIYEDYTFALNNLKTQDDFIMTFLKYELSYDLILFKPSICYNRVPLSVWKSVCSRSQIQGFLESFLGDKYNPKNYKQQLEEIFLYMDTRIKASYLHKQVDILTIDGLRNLAHSGMLLDHMRNLPPFNKDEVKDILEYIKSRDLDPGDNYRCYILREEYNVSPLTIIAAKDKGLFIEYAKQGERIQDHSYCIIEHKEISNAFVDFANNYVPNILALPQSEACNFIDSVIAEL